MNCSFCKKQKILIFGVCKNCRREKNIKHPFEETQTELKTEQPTSNLYHGVPVCDVTEMDRLKRERVKND